MAMLMHASLSASMLILQPQAMSGVRVLTYVLVFGAALWVVVAAVAVANRGQFSWQTAVLASSSPEQQPGRRAA